MRTTGDAPRHDDAGQGGDPTTAWITQDDGDLWQPSPCRDDPSGSSGPILPVFANPTASLAEQEEKRWHDLLEALGFERQDRQVPVGFEDHDWSPVFPPDREHVARLLEPVVANSGDIQEHLVTISSGMTRQSYEGTGT